MNTQELIDWCDWAKGQLDWQRESKMFANPEHLKIELERVETIRAKLIAAEKMKDAIVPFAREMNTINALEEIDPALKTIFPNVMFPYLMFAVDAASKKLSVSAFQNASEALKQYEEAGQ